MGPIVKTTEFCDRCKREFTHLPWKTNLFKAKIKKYKNYHFRIPRGDTMYDSEIDIDLCRDCSKALDEFLNGKKEASDAGNTV